MDQPNSDTGDDFASSDSQYPAPGEVLPEALYDAVFGSPSVFGRILLIASLRNSATGRYESGLAANFPDPAVEAALARLHLEVFRSWLMHPVRRQAADISIYLNQCGSAADIRQLKAMGERSVPAGAKPMERDLFLKDLKIVHVLLSYDH